MASFETIDKFEWIGYLVGAVTIIIGVFQIIIGCLDKDWKKQQVNKYKEQGAAQGWAQPQAQPQPPVVQPPLNDQLTSANAAPAQPYPSLAGDAGMPSQAVYTQQQPMTSQAPLESQQDANRQLAMEAAKMFVIFVLFECIYIYVSISFLIIYYIINYILLYFYLFNYY